MLNIIFQNENFVVCDKPAAVLSVPARERNDVRPCLGLQLQKELRSQIFPVHRLDFEVSGLIIFARTVLSHKISQRWFEKKEVQKKYLATANQQDFSHWPVGINTDRATIAANPGQQYIWKTQILRGKKRSFESNQGDWAETKATIYEVKDFKTQWQLYPLTGRPHQLRLEMSRRGFPIDGDELYGSKVKLNRPGIALRAVEIDFLKIQDRLGLPQKLYTQDAET
ncbi:MAG: RNA pseudouridine synthase [Bdellovibrionaceae bacterium]|nr:RNA pseudouridine synthase [Bdellovibrio sp.]